MAGTAHTVADYRVVSRLGKGGMGWVFKAVHEGTDQVAAVKILPPEMASDEKFVTRFLREAHAATMLHHPNLVRVYEAGEYGGIYYIALEYIEGETIAAALERVGKIDIEKALRMAFEVARGLAHAHERGIVHRDVKPQNLMITADGAVKIMDMGLARWTRSRRYHDPTRPGFTVGTPAYMSPEQILYPDRVDHRTDIYSLGATLYHMLVGRPPHLGGDAQEVMSRAIKTAVSYPDDLPEPVVKLLDKMLAKDVRSRLKDAESVCRGIAQVMKSLGYEPPEEVPLKKKALKKKVRRPARRKSTSSRIAPVVVPDGGPSGKGLPVPLPVLIGGLVIVVLIVVLVAVLASSGGGSRRGRGGSRPSRPSRNNGRRETENRSAPPRTSTPVDRQEESTERVREEGMRALDKVVEYGRSHPHDFAGLWSRLESVRTAYPVLVREVDDCVDELVGRLEEYSKEKLKEAREAVEGGRCSEAAAALEALLSAVSPVRDARVEPIIFDIKRLLRDARGED